MFGFRWKDGNDRPPLSAETILGAARRHGMVLRRGAWKIGTQACAGGAYAIACRPILAGKYIHWENLLEAFGWDISAIHGLSDGFEGCRWDWAFGLASRSYRRAYRVGRQVWDRRDEVDVRPAVPPPPPGRPDDDVEPALATIGADDFEPEDHWRSSIGG